MPHRVATFGPFRLELQTGELRRKNRRIVLQPQPLQLLRLLLEHAGQLVTLEEIHRTLWDDESFGDFEHRAGMALKKLRDAFGDDAANPHYIETLRCRGYRFIAPVTFDFACEQRGEGESRHLVGREGTLDDLRASLEKLLRQQRQIIFVSGEAGIGKTTLIDEFLTGTALDVPSVRIARGQCVEGYGGKEAYYPMLEALGELCQLPGGDSVIETLATVAPTWLIQCPALIKRQHEKLLRETAGATRERMLREISAALQSIAAVHPLILVFEDLQWADNATVDLISAIARERAPARLMLLGTYRPLDEAHSLKAVKQDLLIRHLARKVELSALSEADVAAYLALSAPAAPLPDGLSALIYRHCEGNPLFMVAALEHMQERGRISLREGRWQMNVAQTDIEFHVPETLREMIELQVDRLPQLERQVLDVASVVGVSFHPGVIAFAANLEVEVVESACETLSHRHQLVRRSREERPGIEARNGDYEFVHALYREVLYREQTIERRARLHRRIEEARLVPNQASPQSGP